MPLHVCVRGTHCGLSASPNTVRVVWVSSVAAIIFGEKNVGATPKMMDAELLAKKSPSERYWYSKIGNWAHGTEYALREKAHGVISVTLHPGNLQSDLYRDQGFFMGILVKLLMYPSVNGAYTELFGGLSPDITLENTGCWGKIVCCFSLPHQNLTKRPICQSLRLDEFTPPERIFMWPRDRKQRAGPAGRKSSGNGLRSKSARICE